LLTPDCRHLLYIYIYIYIYIYYIAQHVHDLCAGAECYGARQTLSALGIAACLLNNVSTGHRSMLLNNVSTRHCNMLTNSCPHRALHRLPKHDIQEVSPLHRFPIHHPPIPRLDMGQSQAHQHQKRQNDEASHEDSSVPNNVETSVVEVRQGQ